MALSVIDARTQITGFFDQIATALTTAASESVPILGKVSDLPGAGVATLFDGLKTSILDALEDIDAPEPAAEIAAAVNGLGIDGLTASASAGGDVSITFATDAALTTGTTTIDLSEAIGSFLGLSVDTGAECTAVLDCTLILGADGTTSFAPQTTPEVSLGVSADLSLEEVTATLGVADVTLSDADPAVPEVQAEVTVDLTSLLGEIHVGPTEFAGTAGLDLSFAGQDIAGGILPDMAGRLAVGFALEDGAFLPPSVTISNLKVDLGSYFGALNALFGDIGELFDSSPVRQIVDILQAPIPGLNEIGQFFPDLFDKVGGITGDGDDKTTVGDLAAYQNQSVEALLDRWYGAIEVVEMISSLTSLQGLGEIDLSGGTLNGGAIVSLDDPAALVAEVKTRLNDMGLPEEVTGFFDDWELSGLPGGGKSDGELTLNLLENPADILKILLTDDPVDLVSYDVPAVGFSVSAGGFFPVLGPLGFELRGSVAGALDFEIGYDTQGLLDGTVYNGLYLTTEADPAPVLPDRATNPLGYPYLPVGSFDTSFGGGVGVGFFGSGVTVGGGFDFTLYGYFEDAVGGGKFRPGEGLACILDPVGGIATADLNVKISLGFGPFSASKKIVLASTTLADFTTFTCPPPTVEPTPTAPGLATELASHVRLNVGPDAGQRIVVDNGTGLARQPVTPDNPDTVGINENLNETYVIARAREEDGTLLPGKLDVSAFGFTQRTGIPGPIRADFGAGDDVLVVQSDVTTRTEADGGDGEDLLTGGAGADRLRGGAQTDILNGGAGDDELYGGTEDDQLSGGTGGDLLDGGDGFDLVDYSSANEGTSQGVSVVISRTGDSLGSGGEADGDRLRNIEMLIGTANADDFRAGHLVASKLVFDGGAGNDTLIGGLGDDLLIGGIGADHLNGDAGEDGITYVTSWGAVDVDLTRVLQFGGDAEGDRVFNVESVAGSTQNDRLSGNAAKNFLTGFEGNDVIEGRGGTDVVDAGAGDDTVHALADGDTLQGGTGQDLLSYETASGAVIVDLGGGWAQGGGGTDSIGFAVAPLLAGLRGLSSFETLVGSVFGDSLTGDAADNRIYGLRGDDAIMGDAGHDWIRGGEGGDAINGGAGTDWVDYADSGAGVVVDLVFGGAYGTAAGDSFVDVENVFGSALADTLRGTEAANVIDPNVSRNRADEAVEGRGGIDTLRIDYSSAEAEIGGRISGYLGGFVTNAFTRYDATGALYDTVFATGMERLDLRGTRGDDFVGGYSGDDVIVTGAGNDTIYTGTGADRTFAGAGDDFVAVGLAYTGSSDWGGTVAPFLADGGEGIDTFTLSLLGTSAGISLFVPDRTAEYRGANLILSGGAAIRNFEALKDAYLGSGNDYLAVAGRHDNVIRAGDGSDTIAPGLGFDSVAGQGEVPLSSLPYMEARNKSGYYVPDRASYFATGDRLVLDYSSVTADYSVWGETSRYENGINVHYRAYSGGDVVQYDFLAPIYTNGGTYRVRTPDGEGEIVTDRVDFSDIESLDVTGGAGSDTLWGTHAPISTGFFSGWSPRGDDWLTGGAGDDYISGLTGSDVLFGGDGDDFLVGSVSDANTVYFDSTEVDYLYGGAGADRFEFGDWGGAFYRGEDSHGVVMDFRPEEGDSILLYRVAGYRYEARVEGNSTSVYLAYGSAPVDADDLVMVLNGYTGFDLQADYVDYLPFGFAAPDPVGAAAPPASQTAPAPPAVPVDPPDTTRIAPLAAGFTVSQTSDAASLLASLLGGGSTAGELTLSGNAGSFGTFENDPFGLGAGVILSTGEAAELPGANTLERETTLPTPVGLVFTPLLTANGNAVYRADITGLDIRSLTLSDSGSRVGGGAGRASGFDIDAIAISRTKLDFAADAAALNSLSRLDVFDFSNASLSFTPGTQREPSPGGFPYGELIGTRNGLIDSEFARLDMFSDLQSGNSIALGDGGSLGLDLKAPLDTSSPTYLYIGEVGGGGDGEALTATVAGSASALEPQGDLSTDLGLPGAGDDAASLTYTFTPGTGETRFAFEAVLFTEELPERIEAEDLADLFSIRLNGREIGALSNGADLSVRSLVYSLSDDLVMNPVGSGPLAGEVRADAYTKVLTITGAVDPGAENVLTVEVKDGRDGFLDSGILIGEGAFRTLPADYLQIEGTPGRDVLKGSAAAEEVNPRGGNDFVTLAGGADLIRFNDTPGKRDVLTVADFTTGEDLLDLGGATVADIRSSARQTVLDLDADGDMIVLLGVAHYDPDLILT